jgi:hypothetical protein
MRLEFTGAHWSQDDSGFWLSLKVENPFEARRFLAKKKEKKYEKTISADCSCTECGCLRRHSSG